MNKSSAKPENIKLLDPVAHYPQELRRFIVSAGSVGKNNREIPEVTLEFGHHNAIVIHVENYSRVGPEREQGGVERIGSGCIYYGAFDAEDLIYVGLFDQKQINGFPASCFAANLWAKYDLWQPKGVTARFVSSENLRWMRKTYLHRRNDPFGIGARAKLFGELKG